jgi:hypothetical protein
MRLRLAAALSALMLPLTVLPASAAGSYPTPSWVAAQPAGTCFAGSSVDKTCAAAVPVATDYKLAGLAQTNAILKAQPQLAQDEVSCPGAMWHASVLVSRFSPAAFPTRYRLPAGVTVTRSTIAVPSGWYALQVRGSTAHSLLSSIYNDQVHDGPIATGLVSLLYFFTPSGAPRASGTPGSMPLPTTLPTWVPPVAVTQTAPLVLFDLAPGKVHDTLDTLWNDPVAGHGVFIRSLAEAAFGVGRVPLVDVTDADALYSEASISRALIGTSMSAGTIASLSSGTYQCTVSGLPAAPLLLAEAVRSLKSRGVHLVSAAGNDNLSTYFYPAAYAEAPVPVPLSAASCTSPQVWDRAAKMCTTSAASTVTAAGSLTALEGALTTYTTGQTKPAGASLFSNYGSWVKAWADGDGVVGSYVDGPFRYCIATAKTCDLGDGGPGIKLSMAPTAHLGGSVLWSGTSFAAPMVAIWLAAGNRAP